jgi:sugar porter (SP) family MFS transporter
MAQRSFLSGLFFWALTSALAGFLFGFDTIVISGAEKKIQSLWELNGTMHGLCMSSALWGTVLGALVGGWPTDRFGRKTTLQAIGWLYFLSAIASAMAPEAFTFMLARFIGGVGVGVATVVSPLYISEISPPGHRGRLAGLFQFNIVLGILIAFVSNYLIGRYVNSEFAWRWMLGVEALPALVYTIMCFTLPESPRWLIVKGHDQEKAISIFRQISPHASDEELQELVQTVELSGHQHAQRKPFFVWGLRVPILIAFFVAFFNQLSGVNAILYFAPRIFEWTGLAESSALLQSVGIGITNLIFTYVGLWLIDRLGRRTLLFLGSLGYIGSLGLCSWAFYTQTYTIVPGCIFAFIAAHAMGQGAVIWVLISEVFPNRHRAAGQALGSSTHWLFAALLTMVFPSLAVSLPPWVLFGFFCFMMVLQLIWVLLFVPETKGVPLEAMAEKLGIDSEV